MLYYSKDIENFSTGLKRISLACEEAGVKVEFKLMKMGFAVVFYRPAEKFSTTTKDENGDVNGDVNGDELNAFLLLEAIRANPKKTQKKLAEETGLSARTISRVIRKLRETGVIRRVGSDKTGYWEII